MSIISGRIVNAYLETLLWSETLSSCDEEGNPTSITIPEDASGPFAGDTFEDGEPLDSSSVKKEKIGVSRLEHHFEVW
jgi:hypothetical protein